MPHAQPAFSRKSYHDRAASFLGQPFEPGETPMLANDRTGDQPGRREFLKTIASGMVLVTLTPLGCGSGDGGGGGNNIPDCTGVQIQSGSTSAHTHYLCIPTQDLSSPP